MTLLLISTLIVWVVAIATVLSVVKARGLFGRLRRLLAGSIGVLLGTLLAGLLILVHLFQMFAGETLVARVVTIKRTPPEFELLYTPLLAGPPGAIAKQAGEVTRHLILQGDQWAISGGMVKWHPWLTGLGVKSYHKPMRLSGQFSDVEAQRRHLPSVYALEPRADQLWEFFYRVDRYLPFVEAVYGSSAYVYVEPSAVYEIYVSPSGYLIKRKGRRTP